MKPALALAERNPSSGPTSALSIPLTEHGFRGRRFHSSSWSSCGERTVWPRKISSPQPWREGAVSPSKAQDPITPVFRERNILPGRAAERGEIQQERKLQAASLARRGGGFPRSAWEASPAARPSASRDSALLREVARRRGLSDPRAAGRPGDGGEGKPRRPPSRGQEERDGGARPPCPGTTAYAHPQLVPKPFPATGSLTWACWGVGVRVCWGGGDLVSGEARGEGRRQG